MPMPCPFCAEEISPHATTCPHCNRVLEGADADRPARPQSGGSSTKTILIVVLVGACGVLGLCVLLMAALLLPAVSAARDAARRSQSRNNLKQIGIALHNYHDAEATFPPSGFFDPDTNRGRHGWMTSLLPHIEQANLHSAIDFNLPFDDPKNATIFKRPVSVLLNPGLSETTDTNGFALAHYAANDKLMLKNRALRIAEITDGTSNTVMAGEIKTNLPAWGAFDNARDVSLGINQAPNGFGGPFRGGAHMLMADGSVQFLSDQINADILRKLGDPADGEAIDAF